MLDVTVRNKNVEGLVVEENMGFGVRVIVDGYWGFASSNDLSGPEADRVAAKAVSIAKASALVRGTKADIGPPVRHIAKYATPVKKDPFAVPLDAKIALLLRASEGMLSVPGIVSAEASTSSPASIP